MPQPRAEAIKTLESHPEFTLVHKLLFCSEFHIDQWFVPAIIQFLSLPMDEWPDNAIPLLGRLLIPVIKVKGVLDKHTKNLLNNQLPLLHVCFPSDEPTCQAVWDSLLQDVITRMFHPDDPITGPQAQNLLLANIAKQPVTACFTAGANKLIERKALVKDREILKDGLRMIADAFGLHSIKL